MRLRQDASSGGEESIQVKTASCVSRRTGTPLEGSAQKPRRSAAGGATTIILTPRPASTASKRFTNSASLMA